MTDENGLSSPLDGDVLSFGDGGKVDFDLGKSQNVGRGRHVGKEVDDGSLGTSSAKETSGTNHEVGECTAGVVIPTPLVLGEVRNGGCVGVLKAGLVVGAGSSCIKLKP